MWFDCILLQCLLLQYIVVIIVFYFWKLVRVYKAINLKDKVSKDTLKSDQLVKN